MRCDIAQEVILELEQPDAELSSHLAGCEACRRFLALQRSLNEQLVNAYRAPDLSPAFRTGVQARIRSEKRKQRWDALSSMVASSAGLVTSGICAFAVPEMAMLLLTVGCILSATAYIGHVLFVWLTEELGEG
jgi:hypothetical protein